jgi:hypothetical protein
VVSVGRGDPVHELRAAVADVAFTGLEELLHLADPA